MLVRECMSTNVMTVAPSDRAWIAVELLTGGETRGLPVVEPDRRLVAMVSELDLIRALRRGCDLCDLAVRDVMHTQPLVVSPEDDLIAAAALMDDERVYELPVCQDGRLLGVLSRADVLRALAFAGLRHRATTTR
jgi:CBS domain-containing protein